ncbi:MAG: HRDC domain-containing protein [Chloroflexi bacterium]|nr:HRDC domain-containing protein [Chloroflexota bacterium]
MIKFPPAAYIQSNDALGALVAQLAREPLLAVDTESNSMYAYRERVCLVQISTPGADYIIDPLANVDMQLLAPLMANPQIEKVFHAAEYDLICLTRDYGFQFQNIFDTMIAARICGKKNIGLGHLLAEYLEVELDKSHQRDDWGQRPLPRESLHYAQMDTHHLLRLRDLLCGQLQALKRWDEALEVFGDLCYVELPERDFDPDGYWRIGLPHDLNRREMAVLRELYLLREDIAQKRDLPSFKIFSNKTLIALARYMPQHSDELRDITGMSPLLVRRYGYVLLQTIERGRRAKLPPPPPPPTSEPGVTERYMALHTWRKERAQERGVESDVIVSKDTLWALARQAPNTLDALRTIRGLGPWRLQTYGEEILQVLRLLQG